jgi:SAM-dependent methyltransferase
MNAGAICYNKKMNNRAAWENEYRNPKFLTLGTEPINAVRDFMRSVKKQQRKNPADFSAAVSEWSVLDMGCGNGKNLKYIIENFCERGIGYDISETAIGQANILKGNLNIYYEVRSIAEPIPIPNNSIDLAIDATASNSLSNAEREIFLQEIFRVLKPGGYFFVRALCKDGDANAKNLIKQFPGNEADTYILNETGIAEHVFSKEDFIQTYGKSFEIAELEKTTGYQRWGNQNYKRNYWIAYLKKR